MSTDTLNLYVCNRPLDQNPLIILLQNHRLYKYANKACSEYASVCKFVRDPNDLTPEQILLCMAHSASYMKCHTYCANAI